MYKLLRPLLFLKDPEKTHHQAIALGKIAQKIGLSKVLENIYKFEDPSLEQEFLGIKFKNPVGLGAGYDKNAEIIPLMKAFGFGHTEIGSITALPRDGNPKPRLFRLPNDKALINRMGLNGVGADETAKRLEEKTFPLVLGVNITKTHDPNILGQKGVEDFAYSFGKLYKYGQYIAINISCPNTAEGKTFEDKAALQDLLQALKEKEKSFTNKKPVLLKLSPDLSEQELENVLEVAENHNINGYIIGNTSSGRANLTANKELIEKIGKGGLSGAAIKNLSTYLISLTYKKLKKRNIIGMGGIHSAEDAYEKIKAGASLIQVYTGLIYEGPGLVKKINKGIAKFLKEDGYKNIQEAVGVEA